MNAYTTACIVNVAIIIAIGVACYASGTGWPLWALLFLMNVETHDKAKKS
jgi:hypothetical protein